MMRKRRHAWLISVAALASLLFLAKTGLWISEGCPLGFTIGGCGCEIKGERSIFASSENLLDQVDLRAYAKKAVFKLGNREIVVIGDVATINQTTKFAIPPACKKLEFSVRGKTLQVMADGRDLAPDSQPPVEDGAALTH